MQRGYDLIVSAGEDERGGPYASQGAREADPAVGPDPSRDARVEALLRWPIAAGGRLVG